MKNVFKRMDLEAGYLKMIFYDRSILSVENPSF